MTGIVNRVKRRITDLIGRQCLTRDRHGGIAIMAAFLLPVFCGIAALAIDMGRLYLERREVQGVADLAALSAAAHLGSAETAAKAVIDANNIGAEASMDLIRGRYTGEIGIPPSQRFVSGQKPYNAVQVTLATVGESYFSPKSFAISATALGVVDPRVVFSLGSRLVGVRDGVPNAVLSALLGSEVSLSAVSYDALLSGEITLAAFMNALAAQANITAGTYNDVLSANLTLGQVLNAMATAASNGGQDSAAVALTALAASAGASRSVQMSYVIDLGQAGRVAIGDSAQGLDSAVDVLGLVSAATEVANGSRQVSLDLGATIPGLANVSVMLAIGEPLQQSGYVSVGGPGSELRTSQIRLRLIAEVGGKGLLAGTTIRLPIAVDVANATARLEEATCGPDGIAKIGVVAGVAEAWIGETTNLATWPAGLDVTSANIVTTALAKVTAASHVSVGSNSQTFLEFDQSDVDGEVTKTADSSQLIGSLASSLLQNASFTVTALGLPLANPAALQIAVEHALAAAAVPLDNVVTSILETLGVHLGEADVRVYRIACRGAVLGG